MRVRGEGGLGGSGRVLEGVSGEIGVVGGL